MRENEKIKFDKEMIKYNEDLKKEKEQFDKIEMERKYKFIEMNEKRVLNDKIVEKKKRKKSKIHSKLRWHLYYSEKKNIGLIMIIS